MHSQFGDDLVVVMGSYQSGQMGLTVTQLSFDFGGSNPSLPTNVSSKANLRNFCEAKISYFRRKCGSSSVDRALAFQAEGRGFEPRLPLQIETLCLASFFIDNIKSLEIRV